MGSGDVTQWLARWREGDANALDRIVPLVYNALRQVARGQLRGEIRHPVTLSATALVHETYLRLLQQRQIQAVDRNSFLAIAGLTMRRILVDHARKRRRLKRGADVAITPLADEDELPALLSESEVDEVLALDEALERLAAADPRAARIVEHRVFTGLTLEETAQALDLSVKTVQRTWTAARAFLRKEIGGRGFAAIDGDG
jgi:RNA polymerase sigma factor (TIGR02999 family)